METKITKRFIASSIADYNGLLATVIEMNLPVDVDTARDTQTITIHFHADDTSAMEHVKQIAATLGMTALDVEPTTMFATIAEATRELEAKCVQLKDTHDALDRATEALEVAEADRDRYRQWFGEQARGADRVRSQVKAIAVLINSIYTEKA